MDAIDTDTPDERARVLAPDPVPEVDTPDAAEDADDDEETEESEEVPAEVAPPEPAVTDESSVRTPA
jgi:hypothetical protein